MYVTEDARHAVTNKSKQRGGLEVEDERMGCVHSHINDYNSYEPYSEAEADRRRREAVERIRRTQEIRDAARCGCEYDEATCPHCGRYDDWSDIEWEDPCSGELVAWARCPECDGLQKLVWTLTENVPVEG